MGAYNWPYKLNIYRLSLTILDIATGQLSNSRDFRAGSHQQKGQRVAADYFMEPAVIIDNSTVGKPVAT
ncbi:hypothetical protein N9383_02025 [Granulosicoccus sp.]|nr:hypothetical protein [Granulosicoccus sp.]